jgi:hypothetical protein
VAASSGAPASVNKGTSSRAPASLDEGTSSGVPASLYKGSSSAVTSLEKGRSSGATAKGRKVATFRTDAPKFATNLVNKYVSEYDVKVASTVIWRRRRRQALMPFENAVEHLKEFEYIIPRNKRDPTLLTFKDAVETLEVLDADFPAVGKLATNLTLFALGEVRTGKQLARLLGVLVSLKQEVRVDISHKVLMEVVQKPQVRDSFTMMGLCSLRSIVSDKAIAQLNSELAAALVQAAFSPGKDTGDVVEAALSVAAFVRVGRLENDRVAREFIKTLEHSLMNGFRTDRELREGLLAVQRLGGDYQTLADVLNLEDSVSNCRKM